ncbi:trigger factor [Desulfoluna sp.]|uniref:trigger factor n=1 Tax=Desulfoluna sp. TaxID=2045199 RepID=UPI002636E0F9|nr:trigger factor [Desulfoluna sp.]
MAYQIEELSSVERKISVSVSPQEVNIAVDALIKTYRGKIEAKGFRKEKVPDSVIETQLKEEIFQKAAQQIFSIHVKEAQELYGIRPLNSIQIESEGLLERDKEFNFSFIAEIIPLLEFASYTGVELEQRQPKVTEADIDHIIERIRDRFARLEEITENRYPADGDVVSVDFSALGKFKGTSGTTYSDFRFELGTGELVNDFETLVKSLKPGETTVGPVAFPTDYYHPKLAGQTVEMQLMLKHLSRKIIPAVDESFTKKVANVPTEEAMRATLRQRHKAKLEERFTEEAKHRLLDLLMKDMDLPIVPTLMNRNIEEVLTNYTSKMQHIGLSITEIQDHTEEWREKFLPAAKAASRKQFFLLSIARKEKLKLDMDTIKEEIRRLANQAETDINQFMIEVQQSGYISVIKQKLIMNKTIDFLYKKANITLVDQLSTCTFDV